MNILIWCIIAIAVLVGAAFFAKWLIETFIPPPARMIFMFIAGVVLLILLVIGVAQLMGAGGAGGVSLGASPFHWPK